MVRIPTKADIRSNPKRTNLSFVCNFFFWGFYDTVDHGDKLTSTSTKSYTYDGDGRTATVTSGGATTSLSYDYESRLTSLAYSGGSTYTYSYNGLDTRVGKNEGTAQTYRRDGVDVTSPVLSDGISHFTPGVSQHTTATTFNHTDQLGSNVASSRGGDAAPLIEPDVRISRIRLTRGPFT